MQQQPSSEPGPADASAALALARLALQAATTVSVLGPADAGRADRAPWAGQAGNLPGYVPGFASPAWTADLLRLADRVIGRHRATPVEAPDAAAAPELAAAGVHVYTEKITELPPGRAPLDLWEESARFGAGSVVAGARSLAAAVLTARAGARSPQHATLLEAVRRHWLVDWTLMGNGLVPAGPGDDPRLLAALSGAIDSCADLDVRPVGDALLRARLWDLMAGPGPDASPLNRRQVAGRRVLLLDLADPYQRELTRALPTWSPGTPGPEEAVLAGLASDLQMRVEEHLGVRDRAVLRCYLAEDRTWTEAAAEAAPGCEDPVALGERVRRALKRIGQEQQRRNAARGSAGGASARGLR